ncbi:MAG: dipeptidase [Pyrinomonadaceae bacterium]
MAFALLLICAGVFFIVLPPLVADWLNPTVNQPPYQVSENARHMHSQLFVADLHCDALLWNRNLLERNATGHVDLPRLREGNVALQIFSVVTKSPRGLNIENNSDNSDTIFWLTLAQHQPLATLNSLMARAVNQAQHLENFAENSNHKFVIIKTKRDLALFLERRQTENDLVAGLLAIEGAHALDGNAENVDVLFDAGFRMMSPSHFFDSEMGGSAHGVKKYGLTEKGREMLRRMEAKKMIFDLAHASAATIDDVLKLATRPVIVSHTGVRGTCNNNRNLTDDQLRGIAKTGGIIGIGFWDTAVCGADAKSIARSIRYTANIIGADHVALGSDFDGSVEAVFDATGMALVTEALLGENFTEAEIRQIMGGNVLHLLSENLPD